MRKNWLVATVAGLVMVAGVAAVVMAGNNECRPENQSCVAGNTSEPSETVLAIEQLPAAVAATIRREAAGATINEIVRKDGCGRSLYEAELLTNGRERDLLVRPDGSVVGEEALAEVGEGGEPPAENARESSETRLNLDQVPAPVAAAIRREAAGAAIDEIIKTKDRGRPVYEVLLKANGVERELVLVEDGTVLEATIALEQVPAPVAATIRRVGDGMTLREIVRVSENGQTIYEATLLSRGREGELRLAADGSILPEEAEDAGEDGGDAGDESDDGRRGGN